MHQPNEERKTKKITSSEEIYFFSTAIVCVYVCLYVEKTTREKQKATAKKKREKKKEVIIDACTCDVFSRFRSLHEAITFYVISSYSLSFSSYVQKSVLFHFIFRFLTRRCKVSRHLTDLSLNDEKKAHDTQNRITNTRNRLIGRLK